MMSLEYLLTDYLMKEFLFICAEDETDFFIYWNCTSQGFEVPGMPTIDITLRNSRKWQFNSTEYFIFPTIRVNSTTPTKARFGLNFHDNADGESKDPSFTKNEDGAAGSPFSLG
mmetsp:Transcript_5867/g.9481  ORF Transcript_5867/g.9481 Transcript_5867/m.9481 type:complete len:114 (+) Transcript_5867:1119-1460(+)